MSPSPKFLPQDLMNLHQFFSDRIGEYTSADQIEDALDWKSDPNHNRLKNNCQWLKDLGAPIEITEGALPDRHPNAKAFRYRHSAFAPNIGLQFSYEHYAALALMMRWMESVIGKHSDLDLKGALDQLRLHLNHGSDDEGRSLDRLAKRILIQTSHHRPIETKRFECIAQALGKRQKLIFNYQNRNQDTSTTHEVHPQALLYYRNNWYLQAKSHKDAPILKYSLDLIHEIELGSSSWMDPVSECYGEGYGLMFEGQELHQARIRVLRSSLPWVQKEIWHPKQAWTEASEDGSRILSFPFTHSEELVRDLLWYQNGIEVLEPAFLRQEIRQALEQSLALYH